MGGLPPAGLQGVLGRLLGEVKPRLKWWIRPKFKEPSTGMGPPLTGSPGRCTESEPEQCVEPDGGQHKRMLRQLARAHRMTEHSSSIGCCCASPDGGAFQERPALNAGGATGTCTTRRDLGAIASNGRRLSRLEGRGLKGR